MTDELSIVPHSHPAIELDAPVWNLDRLRAHLDIWHNLQAGTGNIEQMAAIHASERPTLWEPERTHDRD